MTEVAAPGRARAGAAWLTSLWARAQAPVPVAGLAAFRVLFGGLLFVGLLRFLLQGWVETLYVEPRFFFKYWGFSWVRVWPANGVYLHYAGLLVLAAGIAVGFRTRFCAGLFVPAFAYIQLMDVTNYLNHYVLVLWLVFWLALSPAGASYSVDAWLRARRAPRQNRGPRAPVRIPRFWTWVFRFQLAVVYGFAAVAKIGEDWLVHGQPMGIWMSTRTHLPVIGPLLALPGVPWLMSWAGFLYDATIVGFLSHRASRGFAYATVLVFHALTSALFDIGMFPGIMVVATLVFFPPDWPLRLAARLTHRTSARRRRDAAPRCEPAETRVPACAPVGRAVGLTVVFIALVQVLLPLRAFLYPGHVLWGEQGMRFSWRVMVREKSGSITYHVHSPSRGRTWQASPHDYLTWRQANEMSGQPDLIVQLAHRIADDFRSRGIHDAEVRVDAQVSLNGRPAAPLIDPRVDLAQVEDGIGPASYLLPPPETPPLSARSKRRLGPSRLD